MSDDELREWIRERIDDHVDLDDPSKQTNPWSSKYHVRQDIQYGEYDRQEVVDEIESMIAEGELIYWHGWVAPKREENLVAIIEAERAADNTRKILIGKCNRARRDLADEPAKKAMTDGGNPLAGRGDSSGFRDCDACGDITDESPVCLRGKERGPGTSEGCIASLTLCESCQLAAWTALNERLDDKSGMDTDPNVRCDGGHEGPIAGSDCVDDYLEQIEGTWSQDDPTVLTFRGHAADAVVASVDGDLRVLSSNLIYAARLTRQGVIDAINEYGTPRVTPLSEHTARFDKSDFEDLHPDYADEGGDA